VFILLKPILLWLVYFIAAVLNLNHVQLQKVVAAGREAVDQRAWLYAHAAMLDIGWNNKTVPGADIKFFAVNSKNKFSGFHKSRLNVRVVMQFALSPVFSKLKSYNHEVGMICKDLPCHTRVCIDYRKFAQGIP